MELKDKEHKEPSVTQKVTSYFNIFECGRNILDQLDVTYQQSLMATTAEDEYYKEIVQSLIKENNEGGNYSMRRYDKQSFVSEQN